MSIQRRGAITGVLAPIVALACIFVAIVSYPKFSWTNNALSDLGVVSGITGPLFNFGLYAGGLLKINFAVFGLYRFFPENFVGKIGSALFSATALALIGIGIFNENFGETHYLFSVAFFTLLPISLFTITGAFALMHEKRKAFLTIIIGIIAAAPWLLLFSIHYVSNVAIPEMASGMTGSAWIIAMAYNLLKKK